MTAHGTHRRNRSPRRWIFHAALITAGFVLAASGAAWGYFSATSDGQASVVAGSIGPPATFTATATSPTQVTLRWTPPSSSPPLGTYTYVLAGTLGSGGSCLASMTQNFGSCSVKGLSPGNTYAWTLGVRFDTWFSATVPASATTWHFAGVGAITTWSQHTNTTMKPVAYPSTAAATDLLVMIIARSHNNPVSCPTGWVTQASAIDKSALVQGRLVVCSAVYTGGPLQVTMTIHGTSNLGSEAEIAAFANVTKTAPFETTTTSGLNFAKSTATSVGTFAAPQFPPAAPGDTALSVVMENSGTTTSPTLDLKTTQGLTEGFTAGTSGGQQPSQQTSFLNFAYKSVQSPGPVQFPTWKGTNQPGDVWIGLSLALRANPTGP